MTTIQERLRAACSTLRTKPVPLSVFIPLLQEAADALDIGKRGFGPMPHGVRARATWDGRCVMQGFCGRREECEAEGGCVAAPPDGVALPGETR